MKELYVPFSSRASREAERERAEKAEALIADLTAKLEEMRRKALVTEGKLLRLQEFVGSTESAAMIVDLTDKLAAAEHARDAAELALVQGAQQTKEEIDILTAKLVAMTNREALLHMTIGEQLASYEKLEQRQITTAQQLAASEQRVKTLEEELGKCGNTGSL